MKLFITNLPSFYKINLYNRIAEKEPVLVVYTGADGSDRNADFFRGKMLFDHIFLKGGAMKMVCRVLAILWRTKYTELIVGGWDSPVMWAAAFCSPKRKNAVVVESSYLESRLTGIKAVAKNLFLKRISKAYVPGVSNETLLRKLGYKRRTVITKGVGVFNYVPQPIYSPRNEVKNFLFVGRLVEVKNLKFLIAVFNDLPQFSLTIAGFGEQEQELKAMAKENIQFLGAVDNHALPALYQQQDVFVLPSKSETWGLVVEEALNNGMPVLVSNRVGCAEAIVNEQNGLVFEYDNEESLRTCIARISDPTFHNRLRENISHLDFEQIENEQVNCYLE